MKYTIRNQKLTATFESKGGELVSLLGADGTEYVWIGDPAVWASHAPQLFPYCGRFTDGKYIMDGKEHPMKIHGYMGVSELQVTAQKEDSITFTFLPYESEFGEYDRNFRADLTYTLQEDTLLQSFRVTNNDTRDMYFGYGGHPGFNVPLKEGLSFEDYYLEFSEPANAVRFGMSETCYVQGPHTSFSLKDDVRLDLRHDLFDNDAILLRNVARSVTLKTDKDSHGVTVSYPQMPYLAIWHKPRMAAPYVCIEPWVSVPSRQDVVEVLEEKSDLVVLAPGKVYTNNWSIRTF